MANENVNIVLRAVDKTKGTFKAVTAGLNMVKRAAFSLQSGLLAVGGVAGMGYLIRQSMNVTDQLGKTASKIGITTQALGGLRHAADLTGVASNTLDMALQRMVRRVSEAAGGTGEAVKALQELNLDAAKLEELSPDQQFKAIADAMENVTGQADKVRLAMRLFDSEGVALVNTLKGGSAAIAEMEREAEMLGLRMNSQVVAGVESANDSISKLSKFISGVFHQAVAQLAPVIQTVTENIKEWMLIKIDEHGGVAGAATQIALIVVRSGRAMVQAFKDVSNSLIDFANKAIETYSAIRGFFDDEFEMPSLIDPVAAEGALKFFDDMEQKILGFKDSIGDTQILPMPDPEALEATGNQYKEMLDLTAMYYRKNAALQKIAKQEQTMTLDETARELSSTLAGHNEKMFKMNKAFAIKDALIDTYKAVSKAWASAPFPANVAPAAIALAKGYATVQNIRATQYREKGGPMTKGSPYIVGERGPELVVPNQASTVIPNDQLGGGNNVTINVTTNDATGFDDLLTRSRGTLLGLMNQALNENGRPALT
jgi:hypothetical protein